MNRNRIRFAVPVTNDAGLDSVVSGHFGRSPGFMTLMSDGSGATYLDSRACREASECAPISALARAGVEIVLARSMGRGALTRCHQAGMKIYQTQARHLRDLLLEISEGALVDFPDTALCSHGHASGHHAHHHEEDSDHE